MKRHLRHTVAALLVISLLAVGCAEPEIPRDEPTGPDAASTQPEQFDPLGDALTASVDQLTRTVQQIQTLLATTSTDVTELTVAANDALDLLLYADGSVYPRPRAASERDTSGRDLLSEVLTAARNVGGTRGDTVTSAVRDTLAGDLGGWERDPDGMRRQALDAARDTVDATRTAVGGLDADGMRAVAWLVFASRQYSPDTIRTAFDTAAVHLDMVVLSVAAAHL